MAFDHEKHEIDVKTGYQVHKDTGLRVGIDQVPFKPTHLDPEWPKWVVPHESHVVRRKVDGAPDAVSTPGFEHCHVNRADGVVTVMVADEDHEKVAAAEYQKADPEDHEPVADEATTRAVRMDVERARRDHEAAVMAEAAKEQAALEAEEASRRAVESRELQERERQAALDLARAQDDRLRERLAGVAKAPERPVIEQPARDHQSGTVEEFPT